MTWERIKNLWEYEHPYYMQEGNYYESNFHQCYETWDDFIKDRGNDDIDMNRIHRWDFNINLEGSKVFFFYIKQRKAIVHSVEIKIKLYEQDLIKEFLKPHAELNNKLWAGVLNDEKVTEQ